MHGSVLCKLHSQWLRFAVWPALASNLFLGCSNGVAYPHSPHFDGSEFHNDPPGDLIGLTDVLWWQLTADATDWPDWVATTSTKPAPHSPPGEVVVTFINHSTFLIQVDDLNLLTDPVWSERVSPFDWVGPQRHHAPGVRLEQLPTIDAVVISHDHYDHLDLATITALTKHSQPQIIAGLGQERHLVPAASHVTALDWWQCTRVKSAQVCAVPAQHNSRRGAFDANRTLWAGYYIKAPSGSFYFAGDTGTGPHFEQIRTRLGAPCIALLPIGAYLPRWFMAPNHISPAEAVEAHDVLRAQNSIAMHFGTFRQSDEGMYQPVEELRAALSQGEHAPFLVPTVGMPWRFRCTDEHGSVTKIPSSVGGD